MSDFTGFRFGSVHSSDLHLTVVSSSNRYVKNTLSTPSDVTADIPNSNGQYYFGSTFKPTEFKVNVAFDNINENIWRKIIQIFSNDELQDLVFDEHPYKTYRAKIKSSPDFKFVCFHDRDTRQRIYKGEGSLSFICYYPLAYCFNKYVVRAADYYTCLTPQQIISNNTPKNIEKKVTGLIKDHYNWHSFLKEDECDENKDNKNLLDKQQSYPNMNYGWNGGYPTIQQVQNGELYFKDEKTGNNKMIIDVRNYWDNIPEWECAAKLLTTPTLDYDQELIYLPQYSKTNYYNMEIGLNKQNALIGSRLLVYNPGDVPIDFKLHLKNFSTNKMKMRGVVSSDKPDFLRFRISRYNVERLTIDQAVDWTGLKTYDKNDNEDYKYGTKYFTILEKDKNNITPIYKNLGFSHPNHAYIVEPIPREQLSHFIKMFYWQSSNNYTDKAEGECYFKKGLAIAKRYDELYSLCNSDEERFELYWDTLKECILKQYNLQGKDLETFIYDYIHNPLEYIREPTTIIKNNQNNKNDIKMIQNYGYFNFNKSVVPQFMTLDYFEINNNNFDQITTSGIDQVTLTLDTERRMLYNIDVNKDQNLNLKDSNDFYRQKKTKRLFNDNIERGHWFQIPPGWSLIDISPVITEDVWGGKRWIDSRPFKWGTPNTNKRDEFNNIYKAAAIKYLEQKDRLNDLSLDSSIEDIDEAIQFRKWQNNYNQDLSGFDKELFYYHWERDEYGFLKTLADFWRVNHLDEYGLLSNNAGDVSDWWWNANNYIWDNFPPLYWGYADLFNNATIEYIPQFY